MDNPKKKETKKRRRPSGKNVKVSKTAKACAGGAATAEKDPDILINNKLGEKDACDCFNAECPGCWYSCDICGSNKCSPFCRTIARDEQLEWAYFN